MELNYNKEDQDYKAAKSRVKQIKAFYTHATVYCIIIPTIIFMNLRFEPHFHWFWFSTIGWGIGLGVHWFNTFGFRKLGYGKDWEEKKIQEIMQQNKNNYNGK
ncbi:MAG: 2TM domain-containing protein [Polaribacter sp.]